ncbi:MULTISPECIES: HAD-IIA family hydrolase [unclassified Corynebacterium]|uniref:HAD-IIA family hydrolase n=1 Tax=unclassified Corynebacterium TaxID=2624378 RepID=UPI0029CA095E|nr:MULTISPECIES: HAD-IIA family hydrolase [unclassified Corynebacterium]WPF67123.1 HAD-IIA family hydrolase [Corynebacterium sp. 22KM0430]WPF69611.1 HAD-IIA family hydrolase [Corynebacterium sp. 21KM1197]
MMLDKHDALLFDLDGTVWHGDTPIPEAVEALRGLDPIYLTNNASKSPAEVQKKLRGMGLPTGTVLTSAQAAIGLAVELEPGARVLILGAPSFRDLAREAGLRVVDSADEEPQVVLHGHDPETGWAQLSEAALAIRRGARYIASNRDTSLPSERGLLVGNGSMVAAVESATGIRAIAAGKPETRMFEQAARHAKSPLVIGDRLDTDIAGGNAAGMATLHVLTGVSGVSDLLAAPPEQRPTYVAEDMSALHSDANLRPGPREGATAYRQGDVVVVEGETAHQRLLAALPVAWEGPFSEIRGL